MYNRIAIPWVCFSAGMLQKIRFNYLPPKYLSISLIISGIFSLTGCFSEAQNKVSEAEILLEEGNYDEAWELCNDALILEPDNVEGWQCKTKASFGQGKYKEAIALAQETLRDKNDQF